MPTPDVYPDINPDEGQIIVPDDAEIIDHILPTINDITQQQIDEIDNGLAVGSSELDVVTPIDDIPVDENESTYRKRLVRIVNGKITAERVVYMRKYCTAMTGGVGDGYIFLLPQYDPLAGTITFTPAEFYLN